MTSIQWTNATWNPVVGCSRVSAGCDHCYAMGVAHRKMSPQHVGLTKLRPKTASRPGIDWTGEVRFLPERLSEPLRWRKPRRVFVNSMSDLFHERVSNEQIAAVFGVMAACPQHTFQVLTKRLERAVRWFAWIEERAQESYDAGNRLGDLRSDHCVATAMEHVGFRTKNPETGRWHGDCMPVSASLRPWPLPNVHLGASVEDQATADGRIPLLLQCPAAVRWVSYEPALGFVDFEPALDPRERFIDYRSPGSGPWHDVPFGVRLDWIVVGGESGPGARPFDLAWARSTIDQCRDAGVPVFVKQLGANRRIEFGDEGGKFPYALRDRKGGDMAEWPPNLRVREWPR